MKLSHLLLLPALILLCSCYHVDELVRIHSDGSGTITHSISFQAEQWHGELDDEKEWFSEQTKEGGELDLLLKQTAQLMGKGVSLHQAELVRLPQGAGGFQITYAFEKIHQVQLLHEQLLEAIYAYQIFPDKEELEKFAPRMSFAMNDKQLAISLPSRLNPNKQPIIGIDPKLTNQREDESITAEELEFFKKNWRDTSSFFALEFESEIRQTDATFAMEEHLIVIRDYAMNRFLDQEDEVILKFLALDLFSDPDLIREFNKQIKGVRIEPKAQFSVELKN